MDLESDDETLRKLALGDSMDYASWPLLLCTIVARIEKIAHNDFPIPILPAPAKLTPLPMPRFLDPLPSSDPLGPAEAPRHSKATGKEADGSPGSSQETNKENANPAPTQAPAATTPPQPPSPAPEAGGGSSAQQRAALPPQIAAQLTDVTSTLTKNFPSHPPHTIQRLAELVLRPRQHYRSLPSYLHAVDRVVQVASGAQIFPLPPAAPDPAAMAALANGILGGARCRPSSSSAAAASSASLSSVHPGSDEALGGALLTPIPWLTRRAESVDGADAALSPEPDMMDGGSGDDGLGDTSGGGGGSGSHQPHDTQHQGSSRPRQQQRLSTESTETIEGPNGVGHIETVSVSVNGTFSGGSDAAMAAAMTHTGPSSSSMSSAGSENQGVTQGELIREEQRHGVVTVSQVERANAAATAASAEHDSMDDASMDDASMDDEPKDGEPAAAKVEGEGEDDDEAPRLRGPEEIGLADTGPQAAGTSIPAPGQSAPAVDMGDFNAEAAVGRPADADPAPASEDADSVTEGAPTPKRDVESSGSGDDQGEEPPVKKLKGEHDVGGDATGAEAPEKDAKVDSEGDVVIPDETRPGT